MKIKNGFILSPVGKDYMAVAVGPAGETFKGVIQINSAGGFLWNEMLKETTEAELIAKMLERYEGLDEATAKKDLEEFLKTISFALE